MRLLIINPNTTETMTAGIESIAREVADPGTVIYAVNPEMGPESVEGFYDVALSTVGVLNEIRIRDRYDGVVIACFDDTGLDAARTLTEAPIVGIGEAAFHAAGFVSNKFSVITTLRQSVRSIELNLDKYGLSANCGRVRHCDVSVLGLEAGSREAYQSVSDQVDEAKRNDGAEAIVLGCAGMASLAAKLSLEHGIPIIEGVSTAVKLAEALIALGLRTSKIGGYSPPRSKRFSGELAGFTWNGGNA